jgi:hypothetical protein
MTDDEINDIKDEINILVPVILLLATIYSQRQPRMPSNRLHTGQGCIDDLLNCDTTNQQIILYVDPGRFIRLQLPRWH